MYKLDFDERGAAKSFDDTVAGVRGAAFVFVAHGHAFAMRRMPRNGGADVAFVTGQHAADDGEVDFFHRSSGKLIREGDMRFVVFGHDQTAAGFLVEPVDDARSRHAADAAEFPGAMMEQRIDERVFLVPGGGMNHQPGWLVQHEQRFVLKQNLERNVLRLRLGGSGCRARRCGRLRPRAACAWVWWVDR